ncbi:hypothetical protein J4E80_001620 [Alternaria sp. BMP 0032]|nr:hypothetical protein J4E80_001620 [Alternaria sp. BMP 0032]
MTAQSNGEFSDPRDRGEDIRSLDFNEALHHALMLVQARHPSTFEALASTTFGMRTCPIRSYVMGMPQHNIFTEGALPEILHWLPEPWCLPEEGELAKIEALVCQPTNPESPLVNTNENGTRYFRGIKCQLDALDHRWHFSAAAVAINFYVMVPWIEETLFLASYGMPVHSFQLRIDGRGIEAAEAWNLLKYVAATQEALLRQRKASGGPLEPRPAPLQYADCLLGVWSLPGGFARMIRDIAERKSMVYYDGEVGELWDEEEFFQQRKDWTDDDWEEDWRVKVTFTEAITTDCWPSIFYKYSNQSEV